tara:strand:- start:1144 stop:1335 length:192 start_codon:yes stop_codon:yes gene_type:complete
MIDWKDIASKNGLSVEEFKKEIFTSACAIAAIDIDKQEDGTVMKFTCSDDQGPLVMIIKRPTH